MGDCCRIERAKNGFTVELNDPAIVKANQKRDISTKNGPYVPYKSPNVEYVFSTIDEVLAFLKKNLETALPMDEYETSFDAAIGEEDDE